MIDQLNSFPYVTFTKNVSDLVTYNPYISYINEGRMSRGTCWCTYYRSNYTFSFCSLFGVLGIKIWVTANMLHWLTPSSTMRSMCARKYYSVFAHGPSPTCPEVCFTIWRKQRKFMGQTALHCTCLFYSCA